MSETTPTWRVDQLEDRVKRLERRIDQNESRTSQRIFDVYSTIYWAFFVVLIALEVGVIVATAAKH